VIHVDHSRSHSHQPGIPQDAGLMLLIKPSCPAIMVSILVNGEPQTVESDATVSDLLKQLKMNPKFLAVELNRRVVPRAEHDRIRLEAHDELEIVTLVGGG
jgi:sulfur carrier protein